MPIVRVSLVPLAASLPKLRQLIDTEILVGLLARVLALRLYIMNWINKLVGISVIAVE